MPAQKFKIGKAKKIKVDENSFLVVKLTGKVPGKVLREIKSRFNDAVQSVINPVTEQKE